MPSSGQTLRMGVSTAIREELGGRAFGASSLGQETIVTLPGYCICHQPCTLERLCVLPSWSYALFLDIRMIFIFEGIKPSVLIVLCITDALCTYSGIRCIQGLQGT